MLRAGKISILESHIDLVKEWDYEKNEIDIRHLSSGSNKRVWWVCRYGHSWQACVYRRSKGQVCSICQKKYKTSYPQEFLFYFLNKMILCINRADIMGCEVDIYIPELKIGIEYDGYRWHKEKYESDIVKTNKLVDDGIELIRVRECGLKDIPNCFNILRKNRSSESELIEILEMIVCYINLKTDKNFKIDIDLEEVRSKIYHSLNFLIFNNSLAVKYPNIAKEWNYLKNTNIMPEHVSYGSDKKFWWLCKCGHEWQSTINNRTRGNGCPNCAGQIVNEYNCLSTINTILSNQWHPTKNGLLTTNDIMPKSGKRVWWICNCGNEWEATIKNRSNGSNVGCPKCARINRKK